MRVWGGQNFLTKPVHVEEVAPGARRIVWLESDHDQGRYQSFFPPEVSFTRCTAIDSGRLRTYFLRPWTLDTGW